MSLNLLKQYNSLLEFLYFKDVENMASFRRVFNKDFVDNELIIRGIRVIPTQADGEDTMDRLFRHLTTKITDESTKKREFDSDRTIRIHWIRNHIEGKKSDNIIFTVPNEKRIYILDKQERYVIIFEPSRNSQELFLLTAYKLLPANYKNIMTKYEKRSINGIVLL